MSTYSTLGCLDTSIVDLPRECLSEVFACCSTHDRIVCALVCQGWARLLEEPGRHYETLDLRIGASPEAVRKWLTQREGRAALTSSLRLRVRLGAPQGTRLDLDGVLRAFPRLLHVQLDSHSALAPGILGVIARQLPRLETLRVDGMLPTSGSFPPPSSSSPPLKSLSLASVPLPLPPWVSGLAALRVLHLTTRWFGSPASLAQQPGLADGLSDLRGLEELHVEVYGTLWWGDAGLPAGLQCMTVRRWRGEVAVGLWDKLAGATALQSLSLRGLCAAHQSHLACVGGMSALRSLRLSSNEICELPDELSRLTGLQHLDVSGCPRLDHIPWRTIASMRSLQSIDLRNTALSGTRSDDFQLLAQLRSVSRILYSKGGLTSEDAAALAEWDKSAREAVFLAT